VRSDHVIAVGSRKNTGGQSDDRNHSVLVSTTAAQGYDGDIEPADYTVARFADETAAHDRAASLVERMGKWKGGYGLLYVTSQGSVHTSRPRRRHTGTAPADDHQPASDTEPEN
jgi:hypothetical protein